MEGAFNYLLNKQKRSGGGRFKDLLLVLSLHFRFSLVAFLSALPGGVSLVFRSPFFLWSLVKHNTFQQTSPSASLGKFIVDLFMRLLNI